MEKGRNQASKQPETRRWTTGPDVVHAGLIANNTYTNPRYMATIVAGGPGDPEITPETEADCAGNISSPNFDKPMAICRGKHTPIFSRARKSVWSVAQQASGRR